MMSKTIDTPHKKICCICHQPYVEYGNNAWPVGVGRCCDSCNMNIVVPRRIRDYAAALKRLCSRVKTIINKNQWL